MRKMANAGRCWPHCLASDSQQPLFPETWFIIKTTSMLLFADLVNHKSTSAPLCGKLTYPLLTAQTTGKSAEAGFIHHEVSTPVTTLLRWLDHSIKPWPWQHTFISDTAFPPQKKKTKNTIVVHTDCRKKSPKSRERLQDHAGVTVTVFVPKAGCLTAVFFPHNILRWHPAVHCALFSHLNSGTLFTEAKTLKNTTKKTPKNPVTVSQLYQNDVVKPVGSVLWFPSLHYHDLSGLSSGSLLL